MRSLAPLQLKRAGSPPSKQGGAGPSPVQLQAKRPGALAEKQLGALAQGSQQVKAATQLQAKATEFAAQQRPIVQRRHQTGLPDGLKSGVEQLSGMSLDHVRVHYNSSRPAQLQAHAFAQGSQIHLGPGQEKHLPHEAWHVVQQKQGRVRPTMQMQGVAVNDQPGLEREADVMGGRAMKEGSSTVQRMKAVALQHGSPAGPSVMQQKGGDRHYWVTRPGHKQYIGTFKNHAKANDWWAANKSSWVGYTFTQGTSATKIR
jgi:hypothetical protein